MFQRVISRGHAVLQGRQKWAGERHTSSTKNFSGGSLLWEVITDLVTLIPMEVCGPKIIEARF